MRFLDLAATSAAVAATTGRRAKVELLADALRALDASEVSVGSGYLAGELRQRQTGVGWASLRDLPPPAAEPTLTVTAVDAAIDEIAAVHGPGSQARRRHLLAALFGAATADEQRLLVDLFRGELRQGAQAGLLADAVAKAAEVPVTAVRRALLLAGDLRAVALAARTGGAAALAGFGLQVGRPLAPMLAQSAPSVDAALQATGVPAVVDVKLDGIRIQVHRSGDDVAVFTRSLDEITARLPGVVAAVRALPVRDVVLDGEAIGLDTAGRPLPFPQTSSRAARRASAAATGVTSAVGATAAADVAPLAEATALTPYFFDLLHLDGDDLIDLPGRERWARLADVVDGSLLVGRAEVEDPEQAGAVFAAAIDAGQEGWWSSRLTHPTTPVDGAPPGSRSSPDTPSTWSCWRSSGAAAGGRDGCPTSTSAPGTRVPASSSCSARPSRASPTTCCAGRPNASSGWPWSAATGWCGSAPSRWSRSPSTGCSPAPATRAAWRSGSPGCCATATTSRPPRRTPSTPSGRCTPGGPPTEPYPAGRPVRPWTATGRS